MLDPAEAGRSRCQLPPPQANASWTQPGGTPSNNLGHLALGDQVQKVWSADAGTGSSSSGRLSAVPLVADGKVFTLDAGGTVSAFSSASGAQACGSASVTPENEKREGGLRRRARARRRPSLCHDRLRHGGRHRRRQRRDLVDQAHRRAHPQLADRRRRQDLFRFDRQRALCAERRRRHSSCGRRAACRRPATLLSNVSPAVSGSVVVAPFPAGDVAAYEVDSGKATWSDSLSRSTETTACRHPRRSGAAGDRPGRGVRGQPWRQDDRRLGVHRRAAVDAQYRQHADAVDRRRHRLCRRSRRQAVWRSRRADGKVRWAIELPGSGALERPGACRRQALAGVGRRAPGRGRRADRAGSPASSISAPPVFVSPVVAGGRMYILADNATLIALN